MRSFSVNKRVLNGASVQLDLSGDVLGAAADQLALTIVDTIMTEQLDNVIVDLDAVSHLDRSGIWALLCGYVAAVECGITYRVVNAHDQAHWALQSQGVLDVLADSDDLGALILAVLCSQAIFVPPPGRDLT